MTSQAQELRADEDFKALNCRHCPGCNRVIQKVDGCDAMMCGQNFHGGNQQQGCGRKFHWQSARRYEPNYSRKGEMSLNHQPGECMPGD